jgi:hypothetical protein
MKKITVSLSLLLVVLSSLMIFSACKDRFYNKYTALVPVYADYESFRTGATFEGPKNIEQQGNIYVKDHYLFMVEPNKGVHFIDNSNPSSPNQIGFLNIVGATGMAIKDNRMYVNSLIDLVVFDISNLSAPVEVARLEDQFPNALPYSTENYPYATIDKEKGVVVAWEVKEVKEEVTNPQPTWVNCFNCDFQTAMNYESSMNKNGGGNLSSGTGVSGSISLFTIINDYLYVMEQGSALNPISIADPNAPIAYEKVWAWGGVETLFPYGEYIFMGTPTGMLIYDTENPRAPNYISSLSHARGCDPVVVQDDYAYVTVRSGGECGGVINQLDVIDVSNIYIPTLKKTFQMENPHGLGVDGTKLFICDGDAGLKVFDNSNPLTSGDNLTDKFSNIQATDVIPLGDLLILIGEDGLYQYDYSDPTDLKLLSKIKF